MCNNFVHTGSECCSCNLIVHEDCCTVILENIGGGTFSNSIFCQLCLKKDAILGVRKNCFKRQEKFAEKMISFLFNKFPALRKGDCVTIDVPDVDRGPLDFPTVYGNILAIENGVYQVGILKGWFPRTQLASSENCCITTDQVIITMMALFYNYYIM